MQESRDNLESAAEKLPLEETVLRLSLTIILFSSLIFSVGCSRSPTQTPAAGPQTTPGTTTPAVVTASPAAGVAIKPKVDACALLTSKEIESVQGEAIKETKLTGQSDRGFSISQCFFTLPTFTNSVSLLVAQKGTGTGASDPREFWRDTFHEDKGRDKDQNRDGGRRNDEEEKESTPPQKIAGIGEEAYWAGSRVGGALYVLKGESYLRISIGGQSDQATRIKRSKALAEKALARL